MTYSHLETIPLLHAAFAIIDRAKPPLPAHIMLRDLAWLLFSPDPLAADTPELRSYACPHSWRHARQSDWLQRLQQLAHAPQSLLNALASVPRRLGLYAEALLGFWFVHDPQLQLVMRHQPVHDGKRTLGDFDFILRSEQDGLIHLELAVKFFLGLPGPSSLDHWVGTTLDDSLGIKWRRIIEHQLQLSHQPAARLLLPEPVTRQWCWFKGWMFHPLGHDTRADCLLAPQHCRGVWGSATQLLAHWGTDAQVDHLPMWQRLAPARRSGVYDAPGLCSHIRAWQAEPNPWPRLLARFEPGPHGLEEAERAWLVPDDWLQRATGG